MDAVDLPFKAEYAKTGRASCKGCKSNIEKGGLRLAAMVQSAFHDGKQPNWFHEKCFFIKQRPGSEGDIENFPNLRYEDQERVRKSISELGVGDAVVSTGKGKKRTKTDSAAAKDFGVEYAKSARAECRGCEIKIAKDEIRVRKTVFDTEVGMKYGGQPLWHHLTCFAEIRSDLGWFAAGDALPGFKSLSKDDKKEVLKALPAIKAEDVPDAKKPKLEKKDAEEMKEEKKNEELIKSQMKKFYKFRDAVKSEMKTRDMVELLEDNGQEPILSDSERILDQVADLLTFGALKRCEVCKNGQYVFNTSGYICTGSISEWAKCANLLKEPPRTRCEVDENTLAAFPFLKGVKKNPENRVIKYVAPSASVLAKKAKKEEQLEPKVKRERPPLYNLKFAMIGLKDPSGELKKRVASLGGKVEPSITENTFAIFATEKDVERMNQRMQLAKEFGIHIIPLDYLDAVEEDRTGAVSFVTSKSLCDWGTDPSARIPQEEAKSAKSKSIYTKSVPKSMTLQLKGGLAVDPDADVGTDSHVYVKKDDKYTAVLGLTDIQKNKNSYYKLQVIESDNKNRYWFFRSWGRIGTTIGGNKTEECSTAVEAIKSFKFYYLEKSGNEFANRHSFTKMPGLMYPIDIDYGDDKMIDLSAEHAIKSKLDKPVQDLIKLIFDVDSMKKAMLEFDLDMEKMPLGKLSQKQIQSAYKVLSEIQGHIEKGGSNAQFIDGTNRFYTLIPHSFGVENPPLLDTVEQIKNLSGMLDSLMEIECAYSMLKTEGDSKEDANPLDKHYEQLKTELKPIDKASEEFKLLEQYVQNTHAETHKMYELQIVEIFKVARQGEARRFKPFKKLHNRRLLWHGSRMTNYAGILSHGLKIAPPEAPSTGYMFGKGVYFADMVSKSANYCFTSKQNNTGLMLLSEVALGDMYECTEAKYVTKLPKDKHSTFGKGRTMPHPKESHKRPDGVEIPLGKPITHDKLKTSLLYNEFIVYDVAQVNIQYLFRMNFNYKY